LKRQNHSIRNLLTCNTSLALGLNEQSSREFLDAYAFVVSCTVLLYSHAVHAISRLLFVIGIYVF